MFGVVEVVLKLSCFVILYFLMMGFLFVFLEIILMFEIESVGVFVYNLVGGCRNLVVCVMNIGKLVEFCMDVYVDCLFWKGDKVVGVVFVDGSEICVVKGVVLSVGFVVFSGIFMRLGVGFKSDFKKFGIDCCEDVFEVGENLYDYSGVGLYFEGVGLGYGFEVV